MRGGFFEIDLHSCRLDQRDRDERDLQQLLPAVRSQVDVALWLRLRAAFRVRGWQVMSRGRGPPPLEPFRGNADSLVASALRRWTGIGDDSLPRATLLDIVQRSHSLEDELGVPSRCHLERLPLVLVEGRDRVEARR